MWLHAEAANDGFPPFEPRARSFHWTSRAPQACVGPMEPKPEIAELFADLTAHCEDAAGLAVEGQSAVPGALAGATLVRAIGPHLAAASDILDRIEKELQSPGT